MPTYDNYSQCSAATGFPYKKLKLAKSLGAEGFTGNRIQWELFEKWYSDETNKALLDSTYERKFAATVNKLVGGRSMEEIELSIAAKNDILKDLEIQKRKQEFLSPEEVSAFLIKLRLSFESTVKGWGGELPPKLVGKSQGEMEYIVNNEVTRLLTNFGREIKDKIDKCSKQ